MQLFTHTTHTTAYYTCLPALSCHLDPPLKAPQLTINGVNTSTVDYQSHRQSGDNITDALIAGYEVTRFRVPMIGQYVNTGRGSRVTISPAVPGAQYRITAWALGDGRRSAKPAVVDATTGEAGQSRCKCPHEKVAQCIYVCIAANNEKMWDFAYVP